MKPIVLAPNQFPHFYRGGRRIERLRGLPERTANMPEDWVGSTTTRFGQALVGLSSLADGRLLRDAVIADPDAWLGPPHVEVFGADLGLLVKLLDAGQRLLVHVHPDRRFAAQHLGCAHGKTEAWVVIETEEAQAVVYLGFRETVSEDVVRRWVDGQHVGAMLSSLNALPVSCGDTILVPAGVPHAIGAGVLIVELQEPTDFSVLLEWEGFDLDGPKEGHLGLGFDLALQCVDRAAWGPQRIEQLRGPHDDGSSRVRLLPLQADAFFRAERLRGGADIDQSVAVLVVTQGSGLLSTALGGELELRKGMTVIVPYAAGTASLDGDIEVIRCLPPLATTADDTGRQHLSLPQ